MLGPYARVPEPRAKSGQFCFANSTPGSIHSGRSMSARSSALLRPALAILGPASGPRHSRIDRLAQAARAPVRWLPLKRGRDGRSAASGHTDRADRRNPPPFPPRGSCFFAQSGALRPKIGQRARYCRWRPPPARGNGRAARSELRYSTGRQRHHDDVLAHPRLVEIGDRAPRHEAVGQMIGEIA